MVTGMSDDILNTIEVLTNKVRAKEEEANKLKKLVNELCGEAGIATRYADIPEAGSSVTAIRSDQFYGQTLTAALRNYLEHRKASGLGAASVADIFRAVKDGGYKFGAKNEEIEKISLANALRKSSSIFHRLPNGQYGLLSWYPNAKALPENDAPSSGKGGKAQGRKKTTAKTPTVVITNAVTNKEIRDVILAQQGSFTISDIEAAVKAKFPSKVIPDNKLAAVLFVLKRDKGLLKEVSPRSGKQAAVYAKA